MLGSTDIAPFMFHTDVSQINRKFLKSINPNKKILEIIYEKIRGHFDTQELWFPAFNYDSQLQCENHLLKSKKYFYCIQSP